MKWKLLWGSNFLCIWIMNLGLKVIFSLKVICMKKNHFYVVTLYSCITFRYVLVIFLSCFWEKNTWHPKLGERKFISHRLEAAVHTQLAPGQNGRAEGQQFMAAANRRWTAKEQKDSPFSCSYAVCSTPGRVLRSYH